MSPSTNAIISVINQIDELDKAQLKTLAELTDSQTWRGRHINKAIEADHKALAIAADPKYHSIIYRAIRVGEDAAQVNGDWHLRVDIPMVIKVMLLADTVISEEDFAQIIEPFVAVGMTFDNELQQVIDQIDAMDIDDLYRVVSATNDDFTQGAISIVRFDPRTCALVDNETLQELHRTIHTLALTRTPKGYSNTPNSTWLFEVAIRHGLRAVYLRRWLTKDDYLFMTRPLRSIGIILPNHDGSPALTADVVTKAVRDIECLVGNLEDLAGTLEQLRDTIETGSISGTCEQFDTPITLSDSTLELLDQLRNGLVPGVTPDLTGDKS